MAGNISRQGLNCEHFQVTVILVELLIRSHQRLLLPFNFQACCLDANNSFLSFLNRFSYHVYQGVFSG